MTISCNTSGAEIYYTTDGTNPAKDTGEKYTSAISVTRTTTIKAIAVKAGMYDSGVGTASYTKKTIPVESVTLDRKSASIDKGDKFTLEAAVLPSDATNKEVTWKSSNTGVATVTSKGVVKGIKAGTAKITATAKDGSGKSASCTVTVK